MALWPSACGVRVCLCLYVRVGVHVCLCVFVSVCVQVRAKSRLTEDIKLVLGFKLKFLY